ncbi:MAG: GyrI-like domain-containing protein [Lentimicrobiaceae bacterium]|jgi:hypothetical protein|nr:GyrI-like domain-containing protein [Lentimicrobiaceae bacterium]
MKYRVLKITAIIVALFLMLIFGQYAYLGGFSKIKFQTIECGNEILVYEKMTGSYSETPRVMDSIYYRLLHEFGIETGKGFGIYYDNPQYVEAEKLRSEIGVILEPKDRNRISEIDSTFCVKTLPVEMYLVAEFPFKSPLSIFIGMSKVYPAMTKYVAQHQLNDGLVMEIYDVPNKKIIYRKLIQSE